MLPSIENTIKNIHPASNHCNYKQNVSHASKKLANTSKRQLLLTKPYKYKQKTVATSASTANSNENDSVAKLELALAPDIKHGPPETSVADPFWRNYEATPRY